jgi:hypothetical protein
MGQAIRQQWDHDQCALQRTHTHTQAQVKQYSKDFKDQGTSTKPTYDWPSGLTWDLRLVRLPDMQKYTAQSVASFDSLQGKHGKSYSPLLLTSPVSRSLVWTWHSYPGGLNIELKIAFEVLVS